MLLASPSLLWHNRVAIAGYLDPACKQQAQGEHMLAPLGRCEFVYFVVW